MPGGRTPRNGQAPGADSLAQIRAPRRYRPTGGTARCRAPAAPTFESTATATATTASSRSRRACVNAASPSAATTRRDRPPPLPTSRAPPFPTEPALGRSSVPLCPPTGRAATDRCLLPLGASGRTSRTDLAIDNARHFDALSLATRFVTPHSVQIRAGVLCYGRYTTPTPHTSW
jgi:hypothetical protein